MKKVLLSLAAVAAILFTAGTVSAQVNGPITGKTQVFKQTPTCRPKFS